MKTWIADLATTNFRIFISLMMAILTVLTVLVCLILDRPLQTDIVIALFTFVAGMLGIDVAQFSVKRNTEIVTPPQTTASNATARTVSEIPQPVGRPHPNTNPEIVQVLTDAAADADARKP